MVSDQIQEFGEIWCPQIGKNLSIGFCAESNLAFLVECPSVETYDDFYHDDYWQNQATLEHVMIASSKKKSERRFKRAKLLASLNSIDFGTNPRSLDVGCGLGFFQAGMASYLNCTGFGIESSKYASEIAEKNGVKIVGYAVDDDWAAENVDGYDVVSMIHVLEHIPHPNNMLANISKALRLDGKLILEVPDLDAMKSINYKHPICYSRRSLHLLLNHNGFRVDGMESTLSNNKFRGVISIIATNTRKELVQPGVPDAKEISEYVNNHKIFDGHSKMRSIAKKITSRYYTFRYLVHKYFGLKI